MPVHVKKSKSKGKFEVVDDKGKKHSKPTTKEKAVKIEQAINLSMMREKGDPRAPAKPKRKKK